MWLFLMVPLVGLLFVIVVFPDHIQLLFNAKSYKNVVQQKGQRNHIHFDKTMHDICLAVLK